MSWFTNWFGKADDEPAHLRAGLWGEEQAARFLQKQGMKILGRRLRMGPKEELDIVARAGNVLVFVEVKTRRSEDFGRAASAVDRKKQRKLIQSALMYLKRLKRKPEYFRFDVVEVVGVEGKGGAEIRHLENAFTMNPRIRLPW